MPADCIGDCDGNRFVTVAELVRGVNIALDRIDVALCPSMDRSGEGRVSVDELVAAVGAALRGCP